MMSFRTKVCVPVIVVRYTSRQIHNSNFSQTIRSICCRQRKLLQWNKFSRVRHWILEIWWRWKILCRSSFYIFKKSSKFSDIIFVRERRIAWTMNTLHRTLQTFITADGNARSCIVLMQFLCYKSNVSENF